MLVVSQSIIVPLGKYRVLQVWEDEQKNLYDRIKSLNLERIDDFSKNSFLHSLRWGVSPLRSAPPLSCHI